MKGVPCPQRGNRYDGRGLKEPSQSKRCKAITGLLFGANDFIPERDITVMLGDNLTDIAFELRKMELDGKAIRQDRKTGFGAKQGLRFAWKLTSPT